MGRKRKNKKVVIEVDVRPSYKVPKGHASYRGGAGPHGDKRTKRSRKRADQNRKFIEEQE